MLLSYAQVAGLPGDPSKEAAVVFAKATNDCVISWRRHTYCEQLMFVNGTANVEMKDGQPATLTNGDYIYLSAKHQRQFTCQIAARSLSHRKARSTSTTCKGTRTSRRRKL